MLKHAIVYNNNKLIACYEELMSISSLKYNPLWLCVPCGYEKLWTKAEEVGQALVWLVWLIYQCVGKLRNAVIIINLGQGEYTSSSHFWAL